jgi:acyl-CoA synthetase (AMP-forming)/AMP-acid ligase II
MEEVAYYAAVMLPDVHVGALVEPLSGRRWEPAQTGAEVAARSRRYADTGLTPGARVLLLPGNRIELFAELLAVWARGACAIPVDGRLTAFEVEALARASGARHAVIDDTTSPELTGALERLGVRVLDGAGAASAPAPGAPRPRLGADAPGLGPRADDDALILFTSGSTGRPKGVVHTHRSLRARWDALRERLGVEPFARTLCLLPTHFGHGLICNCLFPWLAGQDLYVLPPFAPDVVARLGTLVDEHGITFLSSVPPVWRLALRLARRPRGGTLRRVHCGSAPLSAALWRDVRQWTGTRAVANTYGITEVGSWVAGLADPDVEPEDGLIGEPWGAAIRILRSRDPGEVAKPGAACAPGEAGHVWLATPALMRGYLDRDDLTAEVVAPGGWFLTGDVGLLDDRGRLHLRGREREEINRGGVKIHPGDVDAVAERFDGVADVCTFGIDDAAYGQAVAMAVVLRPPAGEAAVGSLYGWMRRHLAEHKMPTRWFLLDGIARTSRGKVDREAVRQACAARAPLDLARILAREART